MYIYTGQDAAADWYPETEDTGFPPSFDEWNAIRLHTGKPAGTWADYLHYLGAGETAECPYCGHTLIEQPDGRYTCDDCNVTWANHAAVNNEERVCASYIPQV